MGTPSNGITAQDILNAIKENRNQILAAIVQNDTSTQRRVDGIEKQLQGIEQMLKDLAAEVLAAKPAPAVQDAGNGSSKKDARPARTECPECGGSVWDNRNDPSRGKRPLMRCRDQQVCGWATWKTQDCYADPVTA